MTENDLISALIEDGTLTDGDLHWEVCPHCEGEGKSSAYLGSFTQSERDEMDDEWWEDYMTGAFDKTCPECDGLRVVRCVDDAALARPDVFAAFREWHETEAMYEMERRMGA